jgi:hypothetical protein
VLWSVPSNVCIMFYAAAAMFCSHAAVVVLGLFMLCYGVSCRDVYFVLYFHN